MPRERVLGYRQRLLTQATHSIVPHMFAVELFVVWKEGRERERVKEREGEKLMMMRRKERKGGATDTLL